MVSKKEDLQLYLQQASTNVSFSGFMTAVVVFFTSLLLTQFESFNISIKIPISFLIISMFGFLYSMIIFANASGEVIEGKLDKSKKHELLGNLLSEYLGVYPLVLSIPLVVNVVTTDLFLRIITLISSLGGLMIYQFSHFSLIERYFKEKNKNLSSVILIFGVILFLTQTYSFYFVYVSIIFILFMLILTYYAATHS